jgi:carbon storage regulator CsrA
MAKTFFHLTNSKWSVVMLVLTRKHQEKIRIGDNITITILKTKGKAVRVGIEAPADISVVRGELTANDGVGSSVSKDDELISGESVPLPRRTRRFKTQPAEGWAAKSRPHQTDAPARRGVNSEVTLERVPRGNVAQLLPGLVGTAGPLRLMLEQRATV